MGGREWGEVGLRAYIWSCNLEKEQFCFEPWHNQYTGWMLTLCVFQLDDDITGSLAHSNIVIWLPGTGCCGRSRCAFDSSLSQGSSSLMNTRGLFSNDSKVEFESKIWRKHTKKTYVSILAWTMAEQGYTRKELTKLKVTVLNMSTCLRCVLDTKNQADTNKMTTNALKYIELKSKVRLSFL